MKYFIIAIIATIILFYAFSLGLEKHERMECELWQKHADTYESFEYADWQVEQCSALGIIE